MPTRCSSRAGPRKPKASWSGWHRDGAPMAAAAFRFALDDDGIMPRMLELLVALRCFLFALPYGDQGLLISRIALSRAWRLSPDPAHGGCRSGAAAQAAPARDAAVARGDERRALPQRRLSSRAPCAISAACCSISSACRRACSRASMDKRTQRRPRRAAFAQRLIVMAKSPRRARQAAARGKCRRGSQRPASIARASPIR